MTLCLQGMFYTISTNIQQQLTINSYSRQLFCTRFVQRQQHLLQDIILNSRTTWNICQSKGLS